MDNSLGNSNGINYEFYNEYNDQDWISFCDGNEEIANVFINLVSKGVKDYSIEIDDFHATVLEHNSTDEYQKKMLVAIYVVLNNTYRIDSLDVLDILQCLKGKECREELIIDACN